MKLDLKDLRQAFGRFPSGVTVVTALNESGAPVGFTANSFTSVSLDPPLLLVCPGRHLSSFEVFENCSKFAVNILAEGQEQLSSHFAAFKGDRFDGDHWAFGHDNLPWIKGASAQFSCNVNARYEAGDHSILVGEVTGYQQAESRGLGFLSGQYFNLGLERAALTMPDKASYAGVILEHDEAVYLLNGRLPTVALSSKSRVREALKNHINSLGFEVKIGAAYSLYSTEKDSRHFSFFLASLTSPPKSYDGFVPIEKLEAARLDDPVERTMLLRYAREFQYRNFGLYVGDEADGEVHKLEGFDE